MVALIFISGFVVHHIYKHCVDFFYSCTTSFEAFFYFIFIAYFIYANINVFIAAFVAYAFPTVETLLWLDIYALVVKWHATQKLVVL